MIRSAVTVSLVPEARGGPFVFWDDLPAACRKAAELGFDGIEIFATDMQAIDEPGLRKLLNDLNLKVAAFGTGGGWVQRKLHLTLPDPAQRNKAREFIRSIIDFAGRFNAPAIVGSMQGRWGDLLREEATRHLVDALDEAAGHAAQYNVPLLFEPLNRYETNFITNIPDGVAMLDKLSSKNVKLLADLFHLNIEEPDIAASLIAAGSHVGHIHFADSNRRPVGMGHTDFKPIAAALKQMKFDGYIAAECFSYPNADTAAEQTIQSYRKYFL